jgi:hypothetical protein
MHWNTSIRSIRKRRFMRNSISRSMEVVRWEDYIQVMEAVMEEARIMDIITTIIILGTVQDLGVGAVGLIRMVAIKATSGISRGIEIWDMGG